jgi:endonuclease/exonuclease/phosphatase family metal-dependent hydrolase
MRIDRILASPGLRFTNFDVGCRGASDHLCVVADLSRR